MTMRIAIDVLRDAGGCEECFVRDRSLPDPSLSRAVCDVPHPRWIGPKYFKSKLRIVVVLINPGTGKDRDFHQREAAIFREFYKSGDYKPVRSFYEKSLTDGHPFLAWYRDRLGLDHASIAQINIPWCPTEGNKYPRTMLNHCFERRTSRLLETLAPHVVLLSGIEIHRFQWRISQLLPRAKVIPMLHYKNRGSIAAKQAECARVLNELRRLHMSLHQS
jgi:hypothetical protein